MGDRDLKELLKWSLQNSQPTSNTTAITARDDTTTPDTSTSIAASPQTSAPRGPSANALSALLGGPSEAELMQRSMASILSPDLSVDDKLVAFDNLEQLIESLDNANLLARLNLWAPLLSQLEHEHPEMRLMAAWCVGTAVQNNVESQKVLSGLGGVEKLVGVATDESETQGVRKKAVYALSSAVRNFQPGLDTALEELRSKGKMPLEQTGNGETKKVAVAATDMEAVDGIMNSLKEEIMGTR